tara:strand:+ start:38 stop:325 length:288 start_codon:yes stop_codon:yes gene_type:complete
MKENNKHNILFFEGSTMKGLHLEMDNWQKDNKKRFLSMSINKDGDLFSCIALTNPSEVIIVDGSDSGGAAVHTVENVNHLATRPQAKAGAGCFGK